MGVGAGEGDAAADGVIPVCKAADEAGFALLGHQQEGGFLDFLDRVHGVFVLDLGRGLAVAGLDEGIGGGLDFFGAELDFAELFGVFGEFRHGRVPWFFHGGRR